MAVNCWVRPLPTLSAAGAISVVMSTTLIARGPVIEVSDTNVAMTATPEIGVAGAT